MTGDDMGVVDVGEDSWVDAVEVVVVLDGFRSASA